MRIFSCLDTLCYRSTLQIRRSQRACGAQQCLSICHPARNCVPLCGNDKQRRTTDLSETKGGKSTRTAVGLQKQQDCDKKDTTLVRHSVLQNGVTYQPVGLAGLQRTFSVCFWIPSLQEETWSVSQ